jgi:hypothetical protein
VAVVEEDASAGDAVVCPVVDAATEVWVFTEEVFACGLYAVISFREIVKRCTGAIPCYRTAWLECGRTRL